MSATQKNFQWFEPKEVFRPRLKAEFASVWPGYRLALLIPVGLLLACLTIVLLKRSSETIDTVLCLRVISGVALPLASPWIVYGMHWLFPPLINLSVKGLSIQQGNGVRWLVKDKIASVELDLTQSATPLLTVQTHQQKQVVGLSRKIDPQALLLILREWFPGIPVQCLSLPLPVTQPHSINAIAPAPKTFAPQPPNTTVALNHMNAR